MALQAQHPSNAFTPDFRSRGRNDILEDLQMLQNRDQHIGILIGSYNHLAAGQQICNNTTAFSDPQSQLTCNAASVSRKRSRDDPYSLTLSRPLIQNERDPLHPNMLKAPPKTTTTNAGISTGISQLVDEQSRRFGSSGTSTSGRPSAISATSPVVSPLAQVLVSHLHEQSVEVDALIRLQAIRLRSGLEDARKRHCSALLSVLEARVVKRIQEKDAELESAIRRNAELEEKVRQMSAENMIWFNAAKNNEAIVSSLRTCLEQLLLQTTASPAAPPAMEGYGDSGDVPFPADDAQSCFYEAEHRAGKAARVGAEESSSAVRCRRACSVCREEEVCVLLLPCRHLCLCKGCEPKMDTCPICHSVKNASLQIFVS